MMACNPVDPSILSLIPHRPPFLFISEILEVTEESARAIMQLSGDEAFFAGHYPDEPIMPGVLIVECLVQTGALLLAQHPRTRGKRGYLAAIQETKFKKPVWPRDCLVSSVRLLRFLGACYCLLEGKATVNNCLVAQGSWWIAFPETGSVPE